MSLIQGGPGFPFLHQNVFLYLCTDVRSMLPTAAKCIPCTNIRDVIIKVCNVVITFIKYLSEFVLARSTVPTLMMHSKKL